MAKIKKRKLVWKSSNSPQVVGYKLYWSDKGPVDYESPCVKLGNVTEIVLPDAVEGFDKVKGPVELGITAMDELGNESDLVVLKTPYQFNVPKAPSELWIETLQQYHTTQDKPVEKEEGSTPPIHPFYEGAPAPKPTPDESVASSQETTHESIQ